MSSLSSFIEKPHPARVLLLLPLVAGVLCGCTFGYRTRLPGPVFTLYGNQEEETLTRLAARTRRISSELQKVFELPPERLGSPTLVLCSGDPTVVDYRPQEAPLGTYVPFFGSIRVELGRGLALEENQELLDQVLLHEMAHHFILRKFPDLDSQPWLNEGLACVLEVSVFDAEGFEHPLLNPYLLRVARDAIRADPRSADLLRLTGGSSSEAGDASGREQYYALAWSLVYFVLERELPASLPLSDRIGRVCALDPQSVPGLESRWHAFLRGYDLTGRLLDLVKTRRESAPLTAQWAARRLGDLPGLDGLRVLEGLADVLQDSDSPLRTEASVSFVMAWERYHHSFFARCPRIREAIRTLQQTLASPGERRELQLALARALKRTGSTCEYWLEELVGLLEVDDAELRVAAAETLVALGVKPTVANPRFWRDASPEARTIEVLEWQQWLEQEDLSSRGLP